MTTTLLLIDVRLHLLLPLLLLLLLGIPPQGMRQRHCC
jgi:hypothetical protein